MGDKWKMRTVIFFLGVAFITQYFNCPKSVIFDEASNLILFLAVLDTIAVIKK